MTASSIRFPAQRHEYLLQQLARHGRVEAGRLADELGVSTESIRKDLTLLEDRGLLRRVHGGAIPVGELTTEPAIQDRTSFGPEKRAIARAALRHLPPAGGSMVVDAGSTTALLAAQLPTDRGLLAYTNALPVAQVLAQNPGIDLWTLGGAIRHQTLAAVGPNAVQQLASVNVDVAFLGTNGISFTRGLTTPDPAEAAVKTAMGQAAQRRILLADHSKIGQIRTHRHADLSDLDLLITDAGIDPTDQEKLTQAGITVEIAR
ncbi:MAG TPA: DeoR/GlpR family DNA-binding transcription regulator [Kineosporiaceae bacterium]|nr:DeoR/GlpR family DNA-binding transcription regulator [Kineosporiaceae bacterium]